MAISDNPPAFPNDGRIQLGDDYQGMTLRDYFAGQALAGDCAKRGCLGGGVLAEGAAKRAYQMADMMLSARKGN